MVLLYIIFPGRLDISLTSPQDLASHAHTGSYHTHRHMYTHYILTLKINPHSLWKKCYVKPDQTEL